VSEELLNVAKSRQSVVEAWEIADVGALRAQVAEG